MSIYIPAIYISLCKILFTLSSFVQYQVGYNTVLLLCSIAYIGFSACYLTVAYIFCFNLSNENFPI